MGGKNKDLKKLIVFLAFSKEKKKKLFFCVWEQLMKLIMEGKLDKKEKEN